MNWKIKALLCYFVLPVMERVVIALEKEVEKSKTIWDDVALEGMKGAIKTLKELCKE